MDVYCRFLLQPWEEIPPLSILPARSLERCLENTLKSGDGNPVKPGQHVSFPSMELKLYTGPFSQLDFNFPSCYFIFFCLYKYFMIRKLFGNPDHYLRRKWQLRSGTLPGKSRDRGDSLQATALGSRVGHG